ncbi:unnamed protein product, partial [Rotaria sp. Silwood2]
MDSLLLSTKNEKQPLLATTSSAQVNINPAHTSTDLDENEKQHLTITTKPLGHKIDDQRLVKDDQQRQLLIRQHLSSIQKFDGHANPKIWLKSIIEKFDLLQLTTLERNELISEILTGDALIWYIEEQEHMPTFMTFMKQFLQYFGNQELKTDPSTEMISLC